MFKVIQQIVFAVGLTAVAAVAASAQDFQKSYPLPSGGHISVGNVSGDVIVTGYEGNAVVVTGTITGRDRDRLRIEDTSSANRVEVRVEYPRNCNCDASVRFEVKVPRSTSYDFDGISSVSGDVAISDVSGRVEATTVSGSVKVNGVTGVVQANSVSGDVEVEIARLNGSDSMKFNSVSGNVILRFPSDIDANVDFTTLSGDIQSDFQLEMREKKYGPGKSARGQLGGGSRALTANTVSGDIRLLRNQ
jgi:hypothetical protein